MIMEKIPLVNENDEVIGSTTIDEAKANGNLRRLVRIYIFDGAGSILLQKRSAHMQSYPLHWDQAVGGHVNSGETYYEAAEREMKEELGIEAEIQELTTSHRAPMTFEGVYKAVIDRNTEILFDPYEVETIRWVSIEEFENDIEINSNSYCKGFLDVWKIFKIKLQDF